MNVRKLAVIIFFLLCVMCAFWLTRAKEYYLGFLNKTGENVEDVMLSFNGKPVPSCGNLVKYGYATEGPWRFPIPDTAQLCWREGGNDHSVKVKLDVQKAKSMMSDWNLYFAINKEGHVDVYMFNEKDMDVELAEAEKGLLPDNEYRLAVINRTGCDMTDVVVDFGTNQISLSKFLQARSRANFSYSDMLVLPIPAEAKIEWKENNAPHWLTAKLEGIVPTNYAHGHIWFVLKPDNSIGIKTIAYTNETASTEMVK